MNETTQKLLLSIACLLVLCLSYVFLKKPEGTATKVERKSAESSLVELRTWGTYLITLQIAAIAGMGYFLEKGVKSPEESKAITLSDVIHASPQIAEVRISVTVPPTSPAKVPKAASAVLPSEELLVGGLTMLLFGSSIVIATFLLGAIPSLLTRLVDGTSTKNDVFHLTLFSHSRRPYVGPMTGLQYLLFLLGVLAFAIFMYARVGGFVQSVA